MSCRHTAMETCAATDRSDRDPVGEGIRRQELQKTKPKSRDTKNGLKALYKLISKRINLDYKADRIRIIEKHLNITNSVNKACKELRTHKSWIGELKNKTKNTQNRTEILKIATEFYRNLYSFPNHYTYELSDTNKTEPKADIGETEVVKGIKSLKERKIQATTRSLMKS
ncbi:hypothetical protein EVAR_53104_1 [Eumeta japonica]|uniref:Endonuclease-reverse transcriptase n=1 Tax=Eumeta variegata TaxID=151549 RepID=A0A4C1ZIG0_EUMVA|nr:hypothetical protein EVAR_53104_1 [Eumeta japonica]